MERKTLNGIHTLVNRMLMLFVIYLISINSAFANDLSITLNSIQPSHNYVCPVDSVLSDKVESFLANSPNLSNQARSKLLWQKSKAIFCEFGMSEDYLRQLKNITLLPIDEINHNILSIAIYDLTLFYYRYSPKKACDFLYENRLKLKNVSQVFLKYLDMADVQYCSELTPVEKIRTFVRLQQLNKGDDFFVGNIYISIAEIYSSIGQFSLAANAYKRQLSFITDDSDLHWTYYAIATELIDAGEFKESKQYFKKFELSKDLLMDYQYYQVLLLTLKIKFAYIEKKFDKMLTLLDNFEPYQNSTEARYKNNKMMLFKAIACLENNRIECINEFILNKELLIEQTNETNLQYLYEFLIKYYIAQNQTHLAQQYFETYIDIKQNSLNSHQNSVSILGFAELQQDIVALELGLISTKLEQSKVTLLLSGVFIFLLIAICLYVWHLKNKQTILSETDELTRIFNRRAIFEQINNLKQTQNDDVHAIILFDLDEFKSINDKYSHICGDKALRHIVKLTKMNVRQQDLFGRVGGEEFIVCLKDLEKISAQIIVERIRSSFENNTMLLDSGEKLTITASFSITYVENSKSSFEMLYQKLDNALYKAKDLGRNRVVEV